jgi:predicted RNase H-like nuclease
MRCVTGIDACRGGWVAVELGASGIVSDIRVAATLERLTLAGPAPDGAGGQVPIGIDMPLGLLAGGWRTADALARRALGRRAACVFAIPPRPVWDQPTYADANRRCRELTGRGLSAQAWGLRAKLLEADRHRHRSPRPLHEVHPELSFSELAGAPLMASKHSPEGLAVRRALLRAAGIELPAPGDLLPGVGEDDLLDAAAVAWSAARIASGTARVLADPAQRADDGSEIAIRY